MESQTHVCVFFLLVLGVQYMDATVNVKTHVGNIIGTEETITARDQKYVIRTFLGIPYAKPPTGELRFQKPVPADAFTKPFEATKTGPACSQLKSPIFEGYEHQSEDCLSLNIYVPVQPADQDTGHAVMVWVHGGGFEMGAGESYVGDKLAVLGNVIIVTINYRLGIFGFLSSGDENIPGNMGLFDQHMAFKWVNKNIAAFGGDVNRVTIFGESAGGSSVIFQGLYLENKGLFQRIISQSGVPSMGAAVNPNPKPQFDFVVKGFNCESDTIEQSIKCLKEKDTDTIMNTLSELIAEAAENPANALFVHFLVTSDGEFIRKDALPAEVGERSKTESLPSVDLFRSLDLMIGYNSDDGVFLVSVPGFLPIGDPETFLPSREEFTDQLINMPLGFLFGGDVPSVVKSMVVSQYTDWSNPNSPESNRDKYGELWTDVFFGKGANEYARMHANATDSGTTFLYLFTAPASIHAVSTPSWVLGANHADDLPFVFGFDEKMIKDFNKTYTTDIEEWEKTLSYQMIRYWTNFARTANPNEPSKNIPVWPEFEINEQIAMKLDKDLTDDSAVRYFDAEKTNFWTETIPDVMKSIQQGQGHDSTSTYSQDKNTETCDAEKGCGNT